MGKQAKVTQIENNSEIRQECEAFTRLEEPSNSETSSVLKEPHFEACDSSEYSEMEIDNSTMGSRVEITPASILQSVSDIKITDKRLVDRIKKHLHFKTWQVSSPIDMFTLTDGMCSALPCPN